MTRQIRKQMKAKLGLETANDSDSDLSVDCAKRPAFSFACDVDDAEFDDSEDENGYDEVELTVLPTEQPKGVRSVQRRGKNERHTTNVTKEFSESCFGDFVNIHPANFAMKKVERATTSKRSIIVKYNSWILPESAFLQFLRKREQGATYADFKPEAEIYLNVSMNSAGDVSVQATDRLIDCFNLARAGIVYGHPELCMTYLKNFPLDLNLNLALAHYFLMSNDVAKSHEMIENAVAGIQGGLSFRFPKSHTSNDLSSGKILRFRPNLTMGDVERMRFTTSFEETMKSPTFGQTQFLRVLWYYGWSASVRGYNKTAVEIYKLMIALNPVEDVGYALLSLPTILARTSNTNLLESYAQNYIRFIKRYHGYVLDAPLIVAICEEALPNGHYASELESTTDIDLNDIFADPYVSSKSVFRNRDVRLEGFTLGEFKGEPLKSCEAGAWSHNWFDCMEYILPQFCFSRIAQLIKCSDLSCSELNNMLTDDSFNGIEFWEWVEKKMSEPRHSDNYTSAKSIFYECVWAILNYPDFSGELASRDEISGTAKRRLLQPVLMLKFEPPTTGFSDYQDISTLLLAAYVVHTKSFWLSHWGLIYNCTVAASSAAEISYRCKSPLSNVLLATQVIPKLIHGPLIARYAKLSTSAFQTSDPTCPLNVLMNA